MRCEGFERSPVIVYCDGPRNASEIEAVTATRAVAKNMLGEGAEYHFSELNLGLSRSVIAGVSDTVDRFGRVIVVEDDLELHTSFLTFMNAALDRYENDASVFQISGYQFDVPELRGSTSALFLPFTVSWGWATWKRAWSRFDPLATGWEKLRSDKHLRRRFNLDGVYDYATMLVRQMSGLNDSWAVRWYWTVFKEKGLVLFPANSLVSNIGFDGSGTHGRGVLRRFSIDKTSLVSLDITLPAVYLDTVLFTHIKDALAMQNGGWLGRVVNRLRWWKSLFDMTIGMRL